MNKALKIIFSIFILAMFAACVHDKEEADETTALQSDKGGGDSSGDQDLTEYSLDKVNISDLSASLLATGSGEDGDGNNYEAKWDTRVRNSSDIENSIGKTMLTTVYTLKNTTQDSKDVSTEIWYFDEDNKVVQINIPDSELELIAVDDFSLPQKAKVNDSGTLANFSSDSESSATVEWGLKKENGEIWFSLALKIFNGTELSSESVRSYKISDNGDLLEIKISNPADDLSVIFVQENMSEIPTYDLGFVNIIDPKRTLSAFGTGKDQWDNSYEMQWDVSVSLSSDSEQDIGSVAQTTVLNLKNLTQDWVYMSSGIWYLDEKNEVVQIDIPDAELVFTSIGDYHLPMTARIGDSGLAGKHTSNTDFLSKIEWELVEEDGEIWYHQHNKLFSGTELADQATRSYRIDENGELLEMRIIEPAYGRTIIFEQEDIEAVVNEELN